MRRLFAILLGMMLASGAVMAKPIKVMILDGASAAAYHDWKLGTQILKRELEETGLFDVTAGGPTLVSVNAAIPIGDAAVFAITKEQPNGVWITQRDMLLVMTAKPG